jgi:hypothetical protein
MADIVERPGYTAFTTTLTASTTIAVLSASKTIAEVRAGAPGWSPALKTSLIHVHEVNNGWLDAHTNGLDVTPVNSPTFVAPGWVGSHRASFASASSQYAEHVDDAAYNWTDQFSFSFWILGGWGAIGEEQVIASKWQHGTATEWAVTARQSGHFRLYVADSANANGSVQANTSGAASLIPDAVAYHIVIAYDGTEAAAADRPKIWVDGVAKTWNTVTAGMPAALQNGAAPFRLAAFSGSITRYLDRDLDQPALWSRNLVQSDVDEVNNSGSGAAYA